MRINNSNNLNTHPDCVVGKPRKLMGASCESPGEQFSTLMRYMSL